jgi:hypothetical protein
VQQAVRRRREQRLNVLLMQQGAGGVALCTCRLPSYGAEAPETNHSLNATTGKRKVTGAAFKSNQLASGLQAA